MRLTLLLTNLILLQDSEKTQILQYNVIAEIDDSHQEARKARSQKAAATKVTRKRVVKKAAPKKRVVKKATVRKAAPKKRVVKKATTRKTAVRKTVKRKATTRRRR